jgi:ATP-dependent Lhr-like helicase
LKTTFEQSPGYKIISNWLSNSSKKPFEFQYNTWEKYSKGYSGMVVAPTGYGKTFSVFLAVIIDYLNFPDKYKSGLKVIWITPLRSLANDIAKAMQEAIDEIGLDWVVGIRNGDTDANIKKQQSKLMPDILLLTPESWHLLLAQKGRTTFFKNIKCIAIDEWHELIGTKRGVMIELAVAYLKNQYKNISIWGITATIGNLDEAIEVLLYHQNKKTKIVAKEQKKIAINTVLPQEVEILPWAGHMGGVLAESVAKIILQSTSTLIFTNTRNQCEQWYQLLLDACPELAGRIALHHGSIDLHIRHWIEQSLSNGNLKVVVATSSLDLGVDFKPVDTVIQIGSSKGVARFIQRAGRSGHSPHAISTIYFVPTHSIELFELTALRYAVNHNKIEERQPLILTYDVLVQFLVTIALGGGFDVSFFEKVILNTHAFSTMNNDEWQWCLYFITKGGATGENYEEFHKVVINEDGIYIVEKRKIAMLHRMNIGVIVSDAMMKVKFISGGYVGMIEEYFISRLKTGDKFILAGRVLELVLIKDMEVRVRLSKGNAITPSWVGGRLPLTSNLSYFLRLKIDEAATKNKKTDNELHFLEPLLLHQQEISTLPKMDEFLVEQINTKEGYHLFIYPFEGRLVHEVMAALIAYRISQLRPISFSMAMNDYGFELFTDSQFELNQTELKLILSKDNLMHDVTKSINATEMAKHKFRDIAVISGMVIQNMHGKHRTNKSLQASSGIIFKVLEQYDPKNLLLIQAYNEVFNQQIEEPRLKAVFDRINNTTIIYHKMECFSPLSFPIKVDSLRQSLSSESLKDRITKLTTQHLKHQTQKRNYKK